MKSIFTVILSVFVLLLNAQQSDFFYEHLSIEDGLVNSTVKAIYQDSYGFMWFGTKDGLCRYNGYNFEYFINRENDTTSLADNYIFSITEFNNELYIGTFSKGLSIYSIEENRFKNISFADNDFKNDFPISAVIKGTEENTFYISTLGGGVIVFNVVTNEFKRISTESKTYPLSSNYISDIILLHNTLYIATSGDKIDVLHLEEKKLTNITHSNQIERNYVSFGKIFFHLDSLLLLGTESQRVLAIELETNDIVDFSYVSDNIPDVIITDIKKLGDNKVIFATDGQGIYLWDIENNTVENSRQKQNSIDGLSNNSIWSLFVGNNDVLWIGTFAAGINIYKEQRNKFKTISITGSDSYSLSNKSILDVEFIPNEGVYLGTDGGGLNILNEESGIIKKYDESNGLFSNVIKTIYVDRENNIWLGSYAKGVQVFNNSIKYNKVVDALENVSVWDIIEDSLGNLWFGTLYQGLFCYNKNMNKIKNYRCNYKNKYSIAGDIINVLFIDRNNNLWIGTDGNGISKYIYENDIFENYRSSTDSGSLNSDIIRTIFQGRNGYLYFGTQGGGINILKSPDQDFFYKLTKEDGLPSNTISDIYEDEKKNLWISTSRSICKYDIKSKECVVFDIVEGLRGLEFNYNTLATGYDHIYFGGLKGLVSFIPKNIKKETYTISPTLLSLSVKKSGVDQNILNKPVFVSDSVILPEDIDGITIELGSNDFLFPEKNEFKYRLKGFDSYWHESSVENRKIQYTNIPGGEYTFEYSARVAEGEWSDIKTLIIVKQLKIYEKTTFKVFVTAIFILLILGAFLLVNYRNKIRRLELEEKVKERTHTISLQKDEMQKQRDELRDKHEEITRQREVLQQSNEHMNVQNEELRTQSDLLKEVNDEVMEQNKKILDQAKKIEEKNNLLTKSLNYAKRIQDSLFPKEDVLQKYIKKSFLFFKPKDIVSGDFFWLRKVDDYIILAEVDCTGHGVPGAFMSMIGNALLNEIVVNRRILEPSEVFYNLNKELLDIFNQGDFDTEAEDEGMDLSLAVIDLKKNKIRFASAMQTVFISKGDRDIDIFKGDIFSIGGLMAKFKNPEYNTHEYDITSGLRIIFSSDGFIDQFGGEEREKYGVERFEKLLIYNSTNTLEDYATSIEDSYKRWLRDNEQLDDILIVGFEF